MGLGVGCGDAGKEQAAAEEERVTAEGIPLHEYNRVALRADAERVIADGDAVKLTFYGASRMVGGACTLVEYRGRRLLVDAGIFYMKSLASLDRQFQFDPSTLDWVVLTHAHGDHNGRLPLLYRRGYSGKVYATPPTRDISRIMLELAASIGVPKYRVDFANRSVHNTSCPIAEGLAPIDHLDLREASAWYDIMEYHTCPLCRSRMAGKKRALGEEVMTWFETVEPGETEQLADDVSFRLFNAGHILGSSQLELTLGTGESAVTIVFSGDYGNIISPVLRRPDRLRDADFLVTESTYGAVRKNFQEPYFRDFEEAVVEAVSRGERVIIPAFVLSKSQKVVSLLSELAARNEIPPGCPIIVSSPTVAALDEVYDRYLQSAPEAYFSDYLLRRREWRNPFRNPRLFFGSIKSYIEKNGEIGRPAVFVVSSGMMDFASSLQMARDYLSDPKTDFFIVGWQSDDSVGAAAMNLDEVVIAGEPIPVRATVRKFGQFSSHGDLDMLLENIAGYRDLKGVIVHHGEAESAVNLGREVEKDFGIPVFVPAFLDSLYLDRNSFLEVVHDDSPLAERLRQVDPILELPEASRPGNQAAAVGNLAQAERAWLDGNPETALRFARNATARYPNLADAWYLTGRVNLELGREEEAETAFREMISINPTDYRPYLGLAEMLVGKGDLDGAVVELRSCLYQNPNDVRALSLLGDIYSSSGHERTGLELLRAANSIDPYDEEVGARLKKSAAAMTGEDVCYVASENSEYFHYPWCESARRIDPARAVRSRDRSWFVRQGRKPCPGCNP